MMTTILTKKTKQKKPLHLQYIHTYQEYKAQNQVSFTPRKQQKQKNITLFNTSFIIQCIYL